MEKAKPFDRYSKEYEIWFERNKFAYLSEVNAIKKFIKNKRYGLEIGVGSGRFAKPLNIKFGIDPSMKMLSISKKRKIKTICGIAENLPFKNSSFDLILMVTTICFLNDLKKSLKEIKRALNENGELIIGFVDKNSKLGKLYQRRKKESKFYKIAKFYSTEEIILKLKRSGFGNFSFKQTIFKNLKSIKKIEKVKDGYDKGSFIVILSKKT